MILALVAAASLAQPTTSLRPPDPMGRAIDALGPAPLLQTVAASGFGGRILVARGDTVIVRAEFREPFDHIKAEDLGLYGRTMVWPWASVTKQVVATLVMQEVARGRISLDAPAARYLPSFGGTKPSPSVRQLLQHRAGLRNPDDTPPDNLSLAWKGRPGFYSIGPTGVRWCLVGRGAPGGDWRYNNCDYIVLGALLERVSGQPLGALFRDRIAKPLGLTSTGFARDPLAPKQTLEPFYASPTNQDTMILKRFGAAGGLLGTEDDLLAFDRGLLTGRLLPSAAREEMWRGDPKLGFMALGQWSFTARLKGCADPVTMIERRGEIGRYGVRNILIPAKDLTIIVFTNREGFDFGEIWQGKGFSFDLLSAAACGPSAN